MQRTNTRMDRLERYLAGRPDLSEHDKAELRRAFRVPRHMLVATNAHDTPDQVRDSGWERLPECQCDPDVWGPDGLERGTGHNPICPNWTPVADA